MLNILIVDDNHNRVEKIYVVLNDLGILRTNIRYVKSVFNAKQELSQRTYDLLLLDLVLPNRPNSSPEESGGENLLREISSLSAYKMPRRIFILSEFDEAIQRLSDITNELLFTVIKYESNSSEWEERLKNYIQQIIQTEQEDIKPHEFDAAIICALDDPELAEIKLLPFNWTPYNILGDSTDYFTGNFKGKKLICAASYEMGLPAAAVLATKMTLKFRPQFLFMTGIAGGVKRSGLHIGDVVIADPCFEYESGKKIFKNGKSEFRPDYRQIRLNDGVIQVIRRLATQDDKLATIKSSCTYEKPKDPLQIKIGAFGSGASILSDKTVIGRIMEHNRKLLAFDMEAYAVMLSGMLSCTPKAVPVVMKGISDYGTNKGDLYQKYAAYTSARVLQCLLEELWRGPKPQRKPSAR